MIDLHHISKVCREAGAHYTIQDDVITITLDVGAQHWEGRLDLSDIVQAFVKSALKARLSIACEGTERCHEGWMWRNPKTWYPEWRCRHCHEILNVLRFPPPHDPLFAPVMRSE